MVRYCAVGGAWSDALRHRGQPQAAAAFVSFSGAFCSMVHEMI